MRRLVLAAICGALAAGVCGAASDVPVTDPPTRITYVLGGHMSGPFRLAVDLASGEVEVAEAPKGVRGDPIGISTAWDLPVTRRLKASRVDLDELRTSAVAVWAYGLEKNPEMVNGQPVICIAAGGDRLVKVRIERGPEAQDFSFMGCEYNAAGERLVHKLLCLPRQDDADCKKH